MGKHNKGNKVAQAATAAPVMGAAGKGTQPAQVMVLVVKPGLNLRGARGHWYARLQAHNGQPAAAYLASCAATPPSLPKSGVAESPQGWLSWFVRNNIATLEPAPAA